MAISTKLRKQVIGQLHNSFMDAINGSDEFKRLNDENNPPEFWNDNDKAVYGLMMDFLEKADERINKMLTGEWKPKKRSK